MRQPPSLMGAEEQGTPAAPSKLLSPWQWYICPFQDTTHLGYGGNPQVLSPRPCSITQLCQYHSRISSKPLCQPGELASCEARRSPRFVLTSPNIHWLHHASSCPLGILQQAVEGGRQAPANRHMKPSSLISPGKRRGQIASSRLRCTSAGES